MSVPEREHQEILSGIDELLKEAYALPRTTESWERRLYIDWELFQLFRRLAGIALGESPSTEKPEQKENDEHPRKPHRRDRPAQLPF